MSRSFLCDDVKVAENPESLIRIESQLAGDTGFFFGFPDIQIDLQVHPHPGGCVQNLADEHGKVSAHRSLAIDKLTELGLHGIFLGGGGASGH